MTDYEYGGDLQPNTPLYKYLQTKACRLLFSKNTKLKRKRKRRTNGHLAKAAKALIVSELIAIFHAGHGKS